MSDAVPFFIIEWTRFTEKRRSASTSSGTLVDQK